MNIAYKEDIIDEVFKQMEKRIPGVTKKEIEEIFNISVEYIHDKIEDPNIINIRLTGLGNFYLNGKDALHYYKSNKIPKHTKLIDLQIGKIVAEPNRGRKLLNKTDKFLWKIRKYLFHRKEFTGSLPKIKLYELIENKQNKLFNGTKKN